MGSLVYLRHGIENSPYRSLLETNQWAEICNIFTRDACALLGLSVESPLSVRLGAATLTSLPLCWCRRSNPLHAVLLVSLQFCVRLYGVASIDEH